MQALLYAIGLGAGAIPMAAALNWVIKDGLGQLGGVLYAAVVGNHFDADPKRHRFLAGLALQTATAVELVTPFFPGSFLVLASLANIGKNIAWLASSATRAQLHQALALQENLGDVTAKSGSQSTAAGLAGTGLGILVSSGLDGSAAAAALAYLPFCALSLYALQRSNSAVAVRTLNAQRLDLVLADVWAAAVAHTPGARSLHDVVVRAHLHASASASTSTHAPTPAPSPRAVAGRERLHLWPRRYQPHRHAIVVGPSVAGALAPDAAAALLRDPLFVHVRRLARAHRACPPRALIAVPQPFVRPRLQHRYVVRAGSQVELWVDERASAADLLRGYAHASLVATLLDGGVACNDALTRDAATAMEALFPQLRHQLTSAGWALDHVFVADDALRLRVN